MVLYVQYCSVIAYMNGGAHGRVGELPGGPDNPGPGEAHQGAPQRRDLADHPGGDPGGHRAENLAAQNVRRASGEFTAPTLALTNPLT